MRLNILYKSQHDPDAKKAKGDCMETCISMLASYLLKRNITTDEVVKLAGSDLSKTSIPDAIRAGKALGIKLISKYNQNYKDISKYIRQNKPVICIVDYEKITNRQDKKFKGGHAVLVVGVADNLAYIVNDPDHWGDRRKEDIINRTMFEDAWYSTASKNICRNGTVIVPLEGKKGGDMQLEKEIKRLADIERNLIHNLTECNEKREKWQEWCLEHEKKEKDWKGRSNKYKYERDQANNVLGEKLQKIKELEEELEKQRKEARLEGKKQAKRILDITQELNGKEDTLNTLNEDYNNLMSKNDELLQDLVNQDEAIEEGIKTTCTVAVQYRDKWVKASGISWIIEGIKKLKGGDTR